jgi:hypothetical protein
MGPASGRGDEPSPKERRPLYVTPPTDPIAPQI